MKPASLFFLLVLLTVTAVHVQKRYLIRGRVTDGVTGQGLAGVSIVDKNRGLALPPTVPGPTRFRCCPACTT